MSRASDSYVSQSSPPESVTIRANDGSAKTSPAAIPASHASASASRASYVVRRRDQVFANVRAA